MEGLYIKIEEDGRVKERLKYVRASFAQAVDSSGSHWLDRPIDVYKRQTLSSGPSIWSRSR